MSEEIAAGDARARLEAWLSAPSLPDPIDPLMKVVTELNVRDVGWVVGYLARLLRHPALDARARSRTWHQLAIALMNQARWDDAENALQRALEAAEASGDAARRQSVQAARVRLRLNRFDLVGAATLAPQVFDDGLASGDTNSLVFVLESMGILAASTGRHARADRLMRQALLVLRISPRAWHPSVEASLLHNRCLCSMLSVLDAHNHRLVELRAQRLAVLRRQLDDAVAVATATQSHLVQQCLRPLQALWEMLQHGRAADLPPGREDWPIRLNASYGHLAQSMAARQRGDAELALWHAERALELSHADRYEFSVTLAAQRELGHLHAAAGHWAAAWEAAQRAQWVARQRDDEQAHFAVADALARLRSEHDLAAVMVGRHLRGSVASLETQAGPGADGPPQARLAEVARLADQALEHADAFLRMAELQQLGPHLAADIYLPGLVAEAVDEARSAGGPAAVPADEQVEADLHLRSHARTLHRLLVGLLLDAQQAATDAGVQATVVVSAARVRDGVHLAVHRSAPPLPLAGLRAAFDESLPQEAGRPADSLALRYAGRAAHALGGVAAAVNHPDGSATVALSLPDLA